MVYIIVASFIVFDLVTGTINSIKNKTFTSSIMRQGLYHKCGSVLCVIFGVLVDYAQNYIDLGVNLPIATSICGYIILMECGSIIENIGSINPNILPDKIKQHFSKLIKE